jgi:putative DNA methylase
MAKERPDLEEYIGMKVTVIAWIWARTVKSPNPAFAHVDVPLASTFMLSTKKGKEAYIEPVIENESYHFTIKIGKPVDFDSAKRGTKGEGAKSGFNCLLSKVPIQFDYIRKEASSGRMSERLMAIVAEGNHGRIYLPPLEDMEIIARNAEPSWIPNTETCGKCRVNVGLYGMKTWDKLFTSRQLVALTTFSDLVLEAKEQVKQDVLTSGLLVDENILGKDLIDVNSYADAIAVYLGFGSSRASDAWSSIVTWRNQVESSRNTFARQAIPMTWEFTEVNPFSTSCGNWMGNSVNWVQKSLLNLPLNAPNGYSIQTDAAKQEVSLNKIVSTDPPYYDNIAYGDLSDFFYVWLRRSLKSIYPTLLATLAVPKAEELVATPYRHDTKEKAEVFFLNGMTQAMTRISEQIQTTFPVTIYYAFKQSESNRIDGTANTGWETFLEAVIQAGFALSGTWPMRTEKQGRILSNNANALASSIVLVCRKRKQNAPIATRREFLNTLKIELPEALKHLQHSNIAPVDFAQAAIGPGMAIFTRYSKVIDAEGNAMTVREALALINQILDEVLAEQEGDFDSDSRWALSWFEQYGFSEGEYGVAETLSKAKNTSVSGMVEAGILTSKAGKVKLFKPEELPEDWNPATDERLTVWEMVHHLIRVLEAGGEIAAAELVARLGSKADIARELAYRLYTQCERKKRAQEALAYNSLVQSWPEIVRLAKDEVKLPKGQTKLTED